MTPLHEAALALKRHVVRTPLLETPILNQLVSNALKNISVRVLVKAECLQKTGSFKYRGSMNRILALSEEQKQKGVVAFSSGNFAQALALASSEHNVKCTIFAPHDAPSLKLVTQTKMKENTIV